MHACESPFYDESADLVQGLHGGQALKSDDALPAPIIQGPLFDG
jgi:hypothetical protein